MYRISGIGLNDRLVRIFGSSASLRDALVLAATVVLTIVLASLVDVLATLAHLSRQHPIWQVDKIFVLMVVLATGFFAFSIRRMREIGEVARRRSELEVRFRDFVAVSDDWFWEMDDQLCLTAVADNAPAPLVALARQHAPWQPDSRLVDDDAWARHRAELARRKPFRGFRFHIADAAGTVHHLQISGKPMFDRDGAFRGYRGIGSDVTTEVTAKEASAHFAHYDSLTDLPNRMQLRSEVDQAASLARHHGRPAALLSIDLDRFREINDTLGPAVGDLLLKACALRLRGCLGEDDRLARVSGDEFAIVQIGPDQPDGAAALCRRVLASFARPFDLEGQEVIASASIGVALIRGDEASHDCLKNAGIALYSAKRDRATFCLFEPGMEAGLRLRRALEWDLRRGLEDGEFQLTYQPQIDAASRAIVGLEALVRWLHPERGLLDAKDFMADADETGAVLPLGEWVLRTACSEVAAWPQVRVAVNLSPVQLRHRDLLDLVDRVLSETGLEPGRLEFEIPEQALLPDPRAVATIAEALRERGVRVALGDFMHGVTNLIHLHQFTFDTVKIDRLFTSSLDQRTNAQAAAHAIECIAHGFGREVCAEGVETAEQETMLTTAGCGVLQGNHFSAPMAPKGVAALLGGARAAADDRVDPSAA